MTDNLFCAASQLDINAKQLVQLWNHNESSGTDKVGID